MRWCSSLVRERSILRPVALLRPWVAVIVALAGATAVTVAFVEQGCAIFAGVLSPAYGDLYCSYLGSVPLNVSSRASEWLFLAGLPCVDLVGGSHLTANLFCMPDGVQLLSIDRQGLLRLAVLATILPLLVLAVTVLVLVRVVRVRRKMEALAIMRARAPTGVPVLDLGVGDEERIVVRPAQEPYRESAQPELVIRGDVLRASRFVFRALVVDVTIAALFLALLGSLLR